MAWPVLVFDIESIPDVAGLRQLRGEGADKTDAEVYAAYVEERKAKGQSDFMPLHLQKILCISAVFRNAEGLKVHSMVDRDGQSEGKIIQQFFSAIERNTPQLVSWNGGGFDLPVLHYRGLHQPLPHAPSRFDGLARHVPTPRQRPAGRNGQTLRLSRQTGDGRLCGLWRVFRG
jgi:predicted PolB exonuclease-like 3'-5' exonuclease